jgi:hypothetical protein
MIGMPGIALKGDEFVPGKVLEQSTSLGPPDSTLQLAMLILLCIAPFYFSSFQYKSIESSHINSQ